MRSHFSISATALLLFAVTVFNLAAASIASAQAFFVGPPTPVLSTENMSKDNVYFPDGAIGVLPQGPGTYVMFGAGGSFGGIGPGANIVPSGTYRFSGTLANFAPAQTREGYPVASLQWGRTQPSPFGENFDRDYAGGGPTYAYIIDGSYKLLQLYHGEYHPNYPKSLPFYGGEGMAISDNAGVSFTKIGQFISPHVSLQELIDSGAQGGVPTDGFMIEADAVGNYIDSQRVSADHVYCYYIFSDRQSMSTPQGFAIARIRKPVLLDAIRFNLVAPFEKYYNGTFSQPGLGGSSTFVVRQEKDAIAWPQPIYSAYLRQFLLFYQTNQESIQVRRSTNLMFWSEPTTIYKNTDPELKTYYPTAVGVNGEPKLLGQTFYVYFQKRHVSGQLRPNYYRIEVTSLKGLDYFHRDR